MLKDGEKLGQLEDEKRADGKNTRYDVKTVLALQADHFSNEEKKVLEEGFKLKLERLYAEEKGIPKEMSSMELSSMMEAGLQIEEDIAQQVDAPFGIYSDRYREACKIFLDQLVYIVLQKAKINSEQEKLDKFIEYYNVVLFGHAPSIIDGLSIDDHFDLSAKTTRTPHLNWLGGRLIGTLNYYMKFSPQDVKKEITNSLKTASTAKKLDLLHLLELIGVQSEGEDWTKGIKRLAIDLVEEIKEVGACTFIHHAADCSIESMNDPQKVEFYPAFGRLREDFLTDDLEEDTRMKKRIDFEKPLTGEIIVPLSKDYIGLFDQDGLLHHVVKYDRSDTQDLDSKKLPFISLDEITQQIELNPFQVKSSEDIALLLQQLHRPRMRIKVERELSLNLRDLPLNVQIQLLCFMAEEPPQTFERLRNILPKETDKRQNLLAAFLACSKNRDHGYKILELAEHYPNHAVAIFERFYQIIALTQREEVDLMKALNANPSLKNKPNLIRLRQVILERGVELLNEAYQNIRRIQDIEVYLQEAKRYQLELIAFRGIFDSITTGDSPISPGEIEQLTADKIKVEMVNGGGLLSFDPEALSDQALENRMMDEKSYLDPSKFNKSDYEMVVKNIKETYRGMDEGWAKYLISRIPYHLMNPHSHFILIRNERGNLVGIGRSDKIGENHFYMGTFYVEDGYQGIGRYIGEYLKAQLPSNAEIEGTTAPANPATMWHIEMNGYVGHQIVREGDSGPLIACSNSPGQTFRTKNKKKFSQHFIMRRGEFNDGRVKVIKTNTTAHEVQKNIGKLRPFLELGYRVTRFFYEDIKAEQPQENTWIVLENPSN